MKIIILFFLICSLVACHSTNKLQKYLQKAHEEILSYGPDSVHARGIQIHEQVIYTANSNGHVYSLNLKSGKKQQLTSKAHPELRDIYVRGKNSFAAMQSADTCFFICSEVLNSKNKASVVSCETKFNTFLDAFDINQKGYGVILGDPVASFFQVFITSDFGKNWTKVSHANLKTIPGEAGFAASGTTVQVINDSSYYFISGGKASNLYQTYDFGKTWHKQTIPFVSSEASGPFSMNFWSKDDGIVVGGDYTKPNDTLTNCFMTHDGGKTWMKPTITTSGYKSSVIKAGNTLYACGTNGMDVSADLGNTWYQLNHFNTFSITCDQGFVYATTKQGKIIKIKRFD
jgi:hypothetical protein